MLVIFCYGILLIASIADLHRIDICLDGYYLGNSADGASEAGGYLFNDENGCFTHKAYTSINQVLFYISSFRGIPDLLWSPHSQIRISIVIPHDSFPL